MKYVLFPILYLCLVPIYFMLRNETKPKKKHHSRRNASI